MNTRSDKLDNQYRLLRAKVNEKSTGIKLSLDSFKNEITKIAEKLQIDDQIVSQIKVNRLDPKEFKYSGKLTCTENVSGPGLFGIFGAKSIEYSKRTEINFDFFNEKSSTVLNVKMKNFYYNIVKKYRIITDEPSFPVSIKLVKLDRIYVVCSFYVPKFQFFYGEISFDYSFIIDYQLRKEEVETHRRNRHEIASYMEKASKLFLDKINFAKLYKEVFNETSLPKDDHQRRKIDEL